MMKYISILTLLILISSSFNSYSELDNVDKTYIKKLDKILIFNNKLITNKSKLLSLMKYDKNLHIFRTRINLSNIDLYKKVEIYKKDLIELLDYENSKNIKPSITIEIHKSGNSEIIYNIKTIYNKEKWWEKTCSIIYSSTDKKQLELSQDLLKQKVWKLKSKWYYKKTINGIK